jgi:hypothetical protein
MPSLLKLTMSSDFPASISASTHLIGHARQATDAADGSSNTGDVDTSPAKQDYRQALRDIILPSVSSSDKILPLHQSPASPGYHPAPLNPSCTSVTRERAVPRRCIA